MDSEEQQLKNKADATSTDLNDFNKKLKAARAEQARQEELKKKQAQQTKTAKKSTSKKSSTKKHNKKPSSNNSGNTGGNTTGGSGVHHGKLYYPIWRSDAAEGAYNVQGHTETYYSQRVLPGGGLGSWTSYCK